LGLNKMFFKKALSLMLFLLMASCVTSVASDTDYVELAPSVTKLTKAVEAKVHYHQECTAKMTEKEILYYSIAHDPSLLEPFSHMIIRINQQNGHAIILVCTVDSNAIFEDAGCTAGLDWAWKEDMPVRSCDFKLTSCELK
jgi:hypothetical protein